MPDRQLEKQFTKIVRLRREFIRLRSRAAKEFQKLKKNLNNGIEPGRRSSIFLEGIQLRAPGTCPVPQEFRTPTESIRKGKYATVYIPAALRREGSQRIYRNSR
jgi:hypothetical protein